MYDTVFIFRIRAKFLTTGESFNGVRTLNHFILQRVSSDNLSSGHGSVGLYLHPGINALLHPAIWCSKRLAAAPQIMLFRYKK